MHAYTITHYDGAWILDGYATEDGETAANLPDEVYELLCGELEPGEAAEITVDGMRYSVERTGPIDAARAALCQAGYWLDSGGIVSVGDNPADAETTDPEADEAMAEIRSIVEPLGCRAEWTGSGNTDSDGYSTSDIQIDIV